MSSIRLPGDNTNKTLIYRGLVVTDTDSFTGYEPIKCRIQVTDGNILKDDDLPRCYPLLPKHLNVYPKKGEYVYILMLNSDSQQQIRYYLGPIIDTYKNLPFNPEDNAEINSPVRPNLKKPDRGIYPKREYVSILGRDNNDIILKEKEVLIRAGKYVSDNPLKFNSLDTAYIQLRYGQPESKEVTKKVSKITTKLIDPEGFVTAKVNYISGTTWIVTIKIEDKNNNAIGNPSSAISQNFSSEDNAVLFVKDTFIKLQKNDQTTINLIRETNGNKITNNYDFSRFKYINNSIPQLANFNITKLTEDIKTTEDVTVTETVFDQSKGSVINIVSNKLNLISYANKQGFKLLDPDTTITSEQQIKINSEAQPIPYGYVLNEFLGLIKSFVAGHVHAYSGLPPDPDPTVTQILNFDLNLILNENVRTA